MNMNEPVLAAPLDEEEKQEIFGNIRADATGLKLLTRYVEVFLSKNHLQGYETSEISKRKLAASFVLAAAAFLEIVFFALYHNFYIFILIAGEILFYLIFFHRQNLQRYLVREVIKRPDDNLDNILISQVSGAKKGLRNLLFAVSPLLAVAVVSCLLFMRPHMIFEKASDQGYALRYYTMALIPDDMVVIPETYKGQAVTAIRGNVFMDMNSLKHITLPAGITEIRGSTFERCRNLEEIDIPEGVYRIGGHAFCDCESLQQVTIPSTVNSIGSSAFRRCYCLRTVRIRLGTQINEKAFKESPTKVVFY